MHTFRINAGLPSSVKPLGGWEKPDSELRGHFVGHYLSGCALMYASTGDQELKGKVDYLVAEAERADRRSAAVVRRAAAPARNGGPGAEIAGKVA